MNFHFHSQGGFQRPLRLAHIGINGWSRLVVFFASALRIEQAGYEFFKLTNGELFRSSLACRTFQVLGKASESGQDFAVAESKLPALERVLHRRRKLEQTHKVGDASAV